MGHNTAPEVHIRISDYSITRTGDDDPFNALIAESLNIERRYSCRAMLNFEPVAPPATGGISQINKSSLVVHM